MKRILFMLAIISMIALTACGSSSHVKDIAKTTPPRTLPVFSYAPPGWKGYNPNCGNFSLEAIWGSIIYPLAACDGNVGFADQLDIVTLLVGQQIQLSVPYSTGLGDFKTPTSTSKAVGLVQGVHGLQVGTFEAKRPGEAVLRVGTVNGCKPPHQTTSACPVLTVKVV